MPRINTYTDNTSIEDDDKLLTYDTQGAATKLTAFSRIWTWIQSKIHAITASTSAWTASNDKVVVDRNGTLSRIDYSILAKAIVESYNGSTLAGSAQAVKTAIDALNSKIGDFKFYNSKSNGTFTISFPGGYSSVLLYGIINSTRYVILLSAGNGTPIVVYVYRPNDSSSITVTSVSATSISFTSNNGNDFSVIGDFTSVVKS